MDVKFNIYATIMSNSTSDIVIKRYFFLPNKLNRTSKIYCEHGLRGIPIMMTFQIEVLVL